MKNSGFCVCVCFNLEFSPCNLLISPLIICTTHTKKICAMQECQWKIVDPKISFHRLRLIMIVKLAAERGMSLRWFSNLSSFHGPPRVQVSGTGFALAPRAADVLIAVSYSFTCQRCRDPREGSVATTETCKSGLKTRALWSSDLSGRKEREGERGGRHTEERQWLFNRWSGVEMSAADSSEMSN